MPIEIETLVVGPMEVNCHIAGCNEHKVCAVFDPGDSSVRILEAAAAKGWKIEKVINTHGHADHTGANAKVMEEADAPLLIHKDDEFLLTHENMTGMAAYLGLKPSPGADHLLTDGEEIEICECSSFKVIHTPGHSPGGSCFLSGNALISGDTLFCMSIGRADLPCGDMESLLKSIQEKLMPLPDEVVVYPGHGENSSIGEEKRHNPFITGGHF